MLDENSFAFKIVLLGDQGVGKTSLRRMISGESFNEKYLKTLGVEIKTVKLKSDSYDAELVIWDLAGDAEFREIRKSYTTGVAGCVLVLDVTREIDIENTLWWLEDILKIVINRKVPIALVGNKIDLIEKRIVNEANLDGVRALLDEILNNSPLSYFETSAKTGDGVDSMFDWLVQEMITSATSDESFP